MSYQSCWLCFSDWRTLWNLAPPGYEVGQRIGSLLVLLAVPALIAFVVAGRKKARNPNLFVLIFCLISGFVVLANSATLFSFETPEQHFSRLMREAAGVQPESHRGFGKQRRFDDSIRQQYHKLVQLNRDYTANVKKLDTSKVKDINTARAFASAEAAREGLDQLHALYDADAGHEQDVKETLAGMRRIFESDGGSTAEREVMLKAFDESVAQQLAKRQQALTTEKAWMDAVDEEHAYAEAHRSSIRLVGNQLVIVDPVVRSEFNAKLDDQEAKRKIFVKAESDFNKSQAESLRKMGMSGKDIGQ